MNRSSDAVIGHDHGVHRGRLRVRTARQRFLRWVLLATLAVATVAMHSEMSGVCADHAMTTATATTPTPATSAHAGTDVGTNVGSNVEQSIVDQPASDGHSRPMGETCQAVPRPHGPVLLAGMALIGTVGLAWGGARPRGGVVPVATVCRPPPRQTSLCLWRI